MKVCGIPARTLPPCALEWGHGGRMHGNAGDGFYASEYDEEHQDRQSIVAVLSVAREIVDIGHDLSASPQVNVQVFYHVPQDMLVRLCDAMSGLSPK
jgi:hypothetical protein